MEIVQKFKFYIILGAVLLAYFVFYLFFISPMTLEVEEQIGNLQSIQNQVNSQKKTSGMPNENLLSFHSRQKEILDNSLQEMKAIIQERSLDNWWFPEIKTVSEGEFAAAYRNKKKAIIEKYKNNFKIESQGFSKEEDNFLPLENTVDEKDLSRTQKDFWILEGIGELLKKGKLETLSHIKFFDTKFSKSKDDNTRVLEILGTIQYNNLPSLIESLLIGFPIKDQKEKTAMIELIAIEIEKKEHRIDKETIEVEYNATEEEILQKLEEYKKNLQRELPGVNVKVELRVLDYPASKF